MADFAAENTGNFHNSAQLENVSFAVSAKWKKIA